MASPFMCTASDDARSSRACSSARSRSARTRSRRNWNGRVTARLVGSLDRVLSGIGRVFGVLALVLVLDERFAAERPLAVDQHEPAGGEEAAVHEQLRGLVGLAVEVDD